MDTLGKTIIYLFLIKGCYTKQFVAINVQRALSLKYNHAAFQSVFKKSL